MCTFCLPFVSTNVVGKDLNTPYWSSKADGPITWGGIIGDLVSLAKILGLEPGWD